MTNEAIASDPARENGPVAYGLDPVGNRLSATSSLSNGMSNILSYSLDDQLSTETYDANGNATGVGSKTFVYDSENRLTSMNLGAVTILYDDDGNRVAETAAGVTTRYLVDNLNPTGYSQVVDELTGSTVQREYAYGLQRVDQSQLIGNTWTPSLYGYDGFGSVRQLTNLAGAITDGYAYDAFGNLLSSTGTTPNDFRYRGEQYDSTLGLQYLRARYYNPATGRFMSKDPYSGDVTDPKSLHKYAYAGANPIAGRDPSGWDDDTEVAVGDEISVKSKAGITATGEAVDCALETTAQVLLAITSNQADRTNRIFIGIDAATCGAKAVRGPGKVKPPEPEPTGNPGDPEPPHGDPEPPNGDPEPPNLGGKSGCQDGLGMLQQFRQELGLLPGQKTLALLDVGGQLFYGISGHGQPITMPINAISAQHAEADAFQQAINAGVNAEEGTLYVDRPLCQSCGKFGGVNGIACALGLDKLNVVTP